MKHSLSIIWLIFAVLFFILGSSHWAESKKSIPPFEVTQRELDRPGSSVSATIKFKGTELDKPLKDFATDFNKYLEEQNESSRKSNRRAAWGYFLASLTAFVSMLLEWRDDLSKVLAKIRNAGLPAGCRRRPKGRT